VSRKFLSRFATKLFNELVVPLQKFSVMQTNIRHIGCGIEHDGYHAVKIW